MTHRTPPSVLFVLSVLAFWPSSACAWNPAGHMAIASVAYDALPQARREDLVALLKQHPRFQEDFAAAMPKGLEPDAQDHWIFERASVWPDLTKTLTGDDLAKFNRPVWHYIDLPVFLDEKAEREVHPQFELDYRKAKAEPLMNAVQALHKNLDALNDASLPAPQKAVALCWVLHLAADLHDPVHGAALFSAGRFRQLPAGDRGGNEIHVRENEGLLKDFKTPNLHALWDCMLGIDDSPAGVAKLAGELKATDERAGGAKQQTDFIDWAQESNAAAKRFVYTPAVLAHVAAGEAEPRKPLPDFQITDEYMKSARPVARRLAAVGATRTAAILAPPAK